jgi:hypothetical protein
LVAFNVRHSISLPLKLSHPRFDLHPPEEYLPSKEKLYFAATGAPPGPTPSTKGSPQM